MPPMPPSTAMRCRRYGKLPLKLEKLPIDLVSMSGHKIHAPKGIGALYVKKGTRIDPLIYGGAQQNGLRPGTESLPLACGMGYAAEAPGPRASSRTGGDRFPAAGLCPEKARLHARHRPQLPGECLPLYPQLLGGGHPLRNHAPPSGAVWHLHLQCLRLPARGRPATCWIPWAFPTAASIRAIRLSFERPQHRGGHRCLPGKAPAGTGYPGPCPLLNQITTR